MRSTVPIGTVLAGFRVESLIGEGAMGAVYLAEDIDLYTVNADGTGLFQVTNTPDLDEGGGDWGTHPVTP